ncbi:MAG: NAD(P)-dependent alcohol dehydrogenase [Spirochaetaceae bacterium]
MKAIICTQYGSPEVLKLKEVDKPIPKDNEVLIKVYGTSAHIGDTRIRRADPFLVRIMFGIFRPKKNLKLGIEISGIVESVGKNVKLFKSNDEIFALTGFNLGGYADYICLPEKTKNGTQEQKGLICLKPINLTFEEAAVVPAGSLTALKNLQKAKIKKGDKILINGASGSLGTFAIQLAKYYGAEITAVCSTENFELVKSLGANKTIDYRTEDFTKTNEKYDIVYDAVMKSKKSECKNILKKDGIFLNNFNLPKIIDGDLDIIKEFIEKNILKSIIDKTYSIEKISEAHEYVDKGHKKGNVAITVNNI